MNRSNSVTSGCNMLQSSKPQHFNLMDLCEASAQYKVMDKQQNLPEYNCSDYLSYAEAIAGMNSLENGVDLDPIDAECRVRMVEWCFQVVDFAKLNRETVSLAITLLDRFLSSSCCEAKEVLLCRQKYQLASMAALFLSIKMNEKSVVNASVFAELSRGSYAAKDILAMESSILQALKWRVNGPSPHAFLRYLVKLTGKGSVPSVLSQYNLVDLCIFQLDLAVGDYFFCSEKPSSTAIAAVLNAVGSCDQLSQTDYDAFVTLLEQATGVDSNSNEIYKNMERLRVLLENNGINLHLRSKSTFSDEQRMSPICIMSGMKNVISDASMCPDSAF